jgi:hypothetical protein
MKAKHFIIDYVIYPFNLIVSICETDEQVRQILTEKLPDYAHTDINLVLGKDDSLYVGHTVKFSSGATIIRFPKKPTAGTIAHESLHAVEFLMNAIGDETVGEHWNYLLGYIVNRITEEVK